MCRQKSVKLSFSIETQNPAQFVGGEMANLVFVERRRFESAARDISTGGLKPLGKFLGYMQRHVHGHFLDLPSHEP